MALGFGTQGPMTSSECKQNMRKHTLITQTSIKKLTSKSKIILFFIRNYKTFPIFRGFEQLSSSVSRLVMACGGIHPKLAFAGVEFLPIFGFAVIISAPDMLASQSIALKTWMTAQIPKKI